MTKDEILMYELECLASYEPEDLDYPHIVVCYEDTFGNDHSVDIYLVEMANRLKVRFAELLEEKTK